MPTTQRSHIAVCYHGAGRAATYKDFNLVRLTVFEQPGTRPVTRHALKQRQRGAAGTLLNSRCFMFEPSLPEYPHPCLPENQILHERYHRAPCGQRTSRVLEVGIPSGLAVCSGVSFVDSACLGSADAPPDHDAACSKLATVSMATTQWLPGEALDPSVLW
jgi:hypothetical protein